ncbi:hypothetical protein B0H13DRAFT_255904 [Mycena leptocephala]|nr:hypothetical protein B0H13DRAFT_255904 [Mycena leptocephala]
MSVAFAYGSFGDLLDTAKLVVKVIRFVWAGGKMSQERLALVAELQTLNNDLVILHLLASGMRLDPSSMSSSVVLRILSEAQKCRMILVQFLNKLNAPKGVFGAILTVLMEESQLAKFRAQISRPLKAISTLMLTLNLAVSQGLGVQVEQIGDRLLTAYQETVLKLPIARGVYDDVFGVIDPTGGYIPIALRACRVYSDLDRIIKAYLANRPDAGADYVQRGDYEIVSTEGNIILPVEFTRTVQAGMQVEMSIIKRLPRVRSYQTQSTRCPHCRRTNANEPLAESEWFKCTNPRCGRKYRIDAENPDGTIEEIMSPQMQEQPLISQHASVHDEEASFRLVHVYEVLHTCPQWLSTAMEVMRAKWKNDKFELIIRLNSPEPKWRIICLDCPGKAYLIGPGETLENYKLHFRNRLHRRRVLDRMGNSSNS